MNKIYQLLWVVMFLCQNAAICQEQSSIFNKTIDNFKHLELEQGLSNLRVTSCIQDKRGFMWFGTRLGLNCYNGLKFRTYYPIPDDESSLLNSEISVIREALDRTIWIGTAKGLCSYDYKSETFTRYNYLNKSVGILDIAVEDSSVVWFNTGEGLYRYQISNKKVSKYPLEGDFRPSRILYTTSGICYVMSLSGDLFQYQPQTDTFSKYKIFNADEVSGVSLHFDMTELPNDEVLITSSFSGVKTYNVRTHEVSTLLPKNNSQVPSYIHAVLRRKNGDIWFGTENGIYIIESKATNHLSEIINIRKEDGNSRSLSDNAIYALYEDIEYGVWIGTFSRGVNYLPSIIPDFKKIIAVNSKGDEMTNVIRELISDSKGNIWICSEDAGLFKYSPDADDGIMHPVPVTFEGRATNNILTLLIDDDKLWIGTFDEGIYIYDMTINRIVRHFHNLPTPQNRITSNAILHLFKSSNGDILVGTMVGLYLYDRDKNIFNVIEGDKTGFTNYIYQTRDDTIWVATLNQGLFKLKKLDNSYLAIKEKTTWDDVTTVFEDSKGNFWIGTNTHGLFLYNRRLKSMEQKGINVNGNNIAVCKILEDINTNLWISTSNGLFCYNLQTGEEIRYGVHNSIPTDQFNINAGYLMKNGEIYLGTFKGLVTFEPTKLQKLKKSFKVYFSDFISDESSFSVNCAVPHYSSIQELWYRYKLEGLNKDWIVVQGAPNIKYNNLTPGSYELKVEASTVNGLWQSDKENLSTLEIKIPYPPLRSPLALVIYCIVILASIVIGILSYRKKLIEQRQRRLDKMRNEMNKELLNDKIKFFTDITHEIRTPLTLMMGSIERMKKKLYHSLKKDEIAETVDLLDKNTNRLQNLVNQLLDFRKMEVSSYLIDIRLTDIKAIVKNLYALFSPIAEQRNLIYSIRQCEDDCHVMADPEAVTKIVNNMLSNATKYCDSKVEIIVSSTESEVEIRVNNDGQHISHDELKTVFKPFQQLYRGGVNTTINGTGLGLSLAKKMAELQNASFYYDESHELNSFVFSLHKEKSTEQEKEASDYSSSNSPDSFSVSDSAYSILLVDDESDLRQFVSEELSEKYIVYQADNGQTAFDILEQENVSLIITDIMMPIMNGIELCQKVKADIRFCHIPIVMLTAKVSLNDHIEALNSKSDAYIEKPFHVAELLAQIENLLENRKLLCSAYVRSPFAITEIVSKNEMDNEFLKELSDYVYSLIPDTDITVEMLAEHVYMSYRSFYRKIKGLTSLTPNEFIRYCKLKKATELLDGTIPIKRIAEMTGFSSVSYFTACFTKQFGISPAKVAAKNKRI